MRILTSRKIKELFGFANEGRRTTGALMKIALILYGLMLCSVACSSKQDDYRTFNDCMAGEFQSSIQACTQLLKRQGNSSTRSADLHTLRGYNYLETGDFDKAMADFNQAITLNPKASGAYMWRSFVYERMGQRDRMQADNDQVVSLNSQANTQANKARSAIQEYCVGLFFQAHHTTSAAIGRYTFAIEANPRLAAAYLKRGDVYGIRYEWPKVLTDFEKAIELDPNYSAAYFRRGQFYEQDGKHNKAIADYSKAIGLNPRYSSAYYRRGNLYRKQGKLAKAIADLDKVVELRPRYYKAYLKRGFTFYEMAQYDRAIADFDQTIQVIDQLHAMDKDGTLSFDQFKGFYVAAYNGRGEAYEKKGNRRRAITDYRKALSLDASFEASRAGLKRLGAKL